MKEKLYSIKRKFTDLETDKSFRVSKRTLLNKEKRHRMPLKPEKRPAGPPKSGENPEIVDDVALRERFPACGALGGVVQRAHSSGSGSIPSPQCQITMDDDLENVQRYPDRYPVDLWPEPRLVRAALSLLL